MKPPGAEPQKFALLAVVKREGSCAEGDFADVGGVVVATAKKLQTSPLEASTEVSALPNIGVTHTHAHTQGKCGNNNYNLSADHDLNRRAFASLLFFCFGSASGSD